MRPERLEYSAHKLKESSVALQNWLENNLDDEVWDSIPVGLWNNVTYYAEEVRKGDRHET